MYHHTQSEKARPDEAAGVEVYPQQNCILAALPAAELERLLPALKHGYLPRWLLISLDRVSSNRLTMTQDSIANILGVRREGITVAAGKLQTQGVVKKETDRLLPRVPEMAASGTPIDLAPGCAA